MATWKYQSILPDGVRVFGVFDADDLESLSAYLATRGMTLVDASELSINSALTTARAELPRIVQLRVGERLREALLTELPAHDAIRAIAEEPFEHPVVMLMPWCFWMSVFASLVLGGLSLVLPDSRSSMLIVAVCLPALAGLAWKVLQTVFVHRPKAILLRLADRVEQGGDVGLEQGLIGTELNSVLSSNLDSRVKVAATAELVPEVSGMRLQSHRFAMSILAPLIALSLLLGSVHTMLLTIVPQFRVIFVGFGVSLPGLTQMLLSLSDGIRVFGFTGLACSISLMVGLLVLCYLLLISAKGSEFIEPIPWLGLSIRWQMQSRVARILSVLLRNAAPPDTAIELAAVASGYPLAAADGQHVADCLRQGNTSPGYSRRLSGLPLALLFRSREARLQERHREQSAQAFESYAVLLEQAASGNAAILGIVVELLTIISASLIVGLFVVALFMPLIKLLNDLASLLPGGFLG